MALTARQTEVLDFIERHIVKHGYAPTIREIGAGLGMNSTNGVADHIKALVKKGALFSPRDKSRVIVSVRLHKMLKECEAVCILMDGFSLMRGNSQTKMTLDAVARAWKVGEYSEADK